MFEWSHEPDLGVIDSGGFISFDISVSSSVEDPLDPENPTLTPVENLDYYYVSDPFPSSVVITNNSTSILFEGTVDASAPFIDIAYTENGQSISVDKLEDLPEGAEVTKMIPSSTSTIEYRFVVFGEYEGEPVEREFFLNVNISWDAAKAAILEKVSEIV